MSTNLIDVMTEREAKHLLNDICAIFKIGGAARTYSVVMRNIENSANHTLCKARQKQLEDCLNDFVTEQGCRDSDSDNDRLLPSGDQDDSLIIDAMELLDIDVDA